MEQFLRLMYLKHRYTLGYETLVREVADSLHGRRFCHIALDAAVPHPTTPSKLVRKYGPEVSHDLDIEHPSDIELLDDGVRVITRTVKRLQTPGAGDPPRMPPAAPRPSSATRRWSRRPRSD